MRRESAAKLFTGLPRVLLEMIVATRAAFARRTAPAGRSREKREFGDKDSEADLSTQ